MLSGEPPITRFLAEQLATSHSFSIQAAERDFGYQPIVDVDEGLRRVAPHLKQLAQVS
jgi:nucleoside-diphosphate-sugar epimerase